MNPTVLHPVELSFWSPTNYFITHNDWATILLALAGSAGCISKRQRAIKGMLYQCTNLANWMVPCPCINNICMHWANHIATNVLKRQSYNTLPPICTNGRKLVTQLLFWHISTKMSCLLTYVEFSMTLGLRRHSPIYIAPLH